MVEENKEKLEKRARSIAAMGLVKRNGDHFEVSTPSLRGKQTFYTVRRNAEGKVVCNCPDFEDQFGECANVDFRCEHILAVKFALVAKNTEKPPQPGNEEKEAQASKEPTQPPHSDIPIGFSLDDFKEGWKSMFIRYNDGKSIRQNVIEISESCPFQQVMANRIVNYLNSQMEFGQKKQYPKEPSDKKEFPANPIARSLSDLVTAKQKGMILALSRELGIDADEECYDTMSCKVDELSKRAASNLIQHLQDLAKEDAYGNKL